MNGKSQAFGFIQASMAIFGASIDEWQRWVLTKRDPSWILRVPCFVGTVNGKCQAFGFVQASTAFFRASIGELRPWVLIEKDLSWILRVRMRGSEDMCWWGSVAVVGRLITGFSDCRESVFIFYLRGRKTDDKWEGWVLK